MLVASALLERVLPCAFIVSPYTFSFFRLASFLISHFLPAFLYFFLQLIYLYLLQSVIFSLFLTFLFQLTKYIYFREDEMII
jgi:hypothetical protein